jgi:hypothetical protein
VEFAQEPIHFGILAFDHQLHPTVREIPNETDNRETGSDGSSRITKPDPLNAAGKVDFTLL